MTQHMDQNFPESPLWYTVCFLTRHKTLVFLTFMALQGCRKEDNTESVSVLFCSNSSVFTSAVWCFSDGRTQHLRRKEILHIQILFFTRSLQCLGLGPDASLYCTVIPRRWGYGLVIRFHLAAEVASLAQWSFAAFRAFWQLARGTRPKLSPEAVHDNPLQGRCRSNWNRNVFCHQRRISPELYSGNKHDPGPRCCLESPGRAHIWGSQLETVTSESCVRLQSITRHKCFELDLRKETCSITCDLFF